MNRKLLQTSLLLSLVVAVGLFMRSPFDRTTRASNPLSSKSSSALAILTPQDHGASGNEYDDSKSKIAHQSEEPSYEIHFASTHPPSQTHGQVPEQSQGHQTPIDTSAFLTSLATVGELRELRDDDAHSTPPEILAAGAKIGRLIEVADGHAELRSSSLKTLVACAEDDRLNAIVRAHCLSSATRYSLRWRSFVALADIRASDEIHALAAADAASDGI